MFRDALPVNPYPFASGLLDFLTEESDADEDPHFHNPERKGEITDNKAKRILWILSHIIDGFGRNYDLRRFDEAYGKLDVTAADLLKEMIGMDCQMHEREGLWREPMQKLLMLAYPEADKLDMCDEWKRLRDHYVACYPNG
jgi:hypothetical protein